MDEAYSSSTYLKYMLNEYFSTTRVFVLQPKTNNLEIAVFHYFVAPSGLTKIFRKPVFDAKELYLYICADEDIENIDAHRDGERGDEGGT